ncbi:MAG: hypothetical protein ACQEP9_09490, partial [Bacillota bacterium]
NEQSGEEKEWRVINDQEWLNYIQTVQRKNFFTVQGGRQKSRNRLHYNTWLTTINHQQAEIELLERLIDVDEDSDDNEKQAQFKFHLQPKRIDHNQKNISTKINFKHLSAAGNKSTLEMTSLVKPMKLAPAAVLRQKVNKSNHDSYKYFALYLTGTIVDEAALNNDADFIAMGNMKDINSLFGRKKETPTLWASELAFYLAEEGAKIRHDYWGERLQTAVEITAEDEEFFYEVDLGYSLWEPGSLSLVGRINNLGTAEQEDMAELGVRDKVGYGQFVDLEVAYFPLLYGSEAVEELDSIIEAKLEVTAADWNISYVESKMDDDYFSEAAVEYNFTPQWGLIVEWSEQQNPDGRIYLGIVFNFNE